MEPSRPPPLYPYRTSAAEALQQDTIGNIPLPVFHLLVDTFEWLHADIRFRHAQADRNVQDRKKAIRDVLRAASDPIAFPLGKQERLAAHITTYGLEEALRRPDYSNRDIYVAYFRAICPPELPR